MVLTLKIKKITTDTGMVLGSYDPDRDTYRTLDRPSALMHFVKAVVHNLVRPRSDHVCNVSCSEIVTVCLGAPHHPDLASAAPS